MDNKYNNKLKVPKTLNHQFAVWLSNINIIFIFVSHEYNKQILAVFLTTFSFNAILSFYDNQEHKHSKSMQNHTFENISCSTLLDNFLLLPNIIHCAQKEENRNIEKKSLCDICLCIGLRIHAAIHFIRAMGIDLSPQHMYVSVSNLSVLISIHIGLKMYEIYMRLTKNSSYFICIFLFITATNRHLTNPVVLIWANECPN